MRINVDVINSVIETDNPEITKVLSDKWAFYKKGYQYTRAHIEGFSDGKKRFVTKGGKFKTGMLPLILKDLEQIGCRPEVNFKYSANNDLPFRDEIKGMKLRDYQIEAVGKAITKTRGIVRAPTGAGKTLMMAGLLTAFPSHSDKIVILFDEKAILTQTYEYLTKNCGFTDVGVNFGGEFKDGRIMLSTVQSIGNIIESHVSEAKVLMVDEVHKFCRGEVTVAAIHSFPEATYRFGFTATMPDDRIGELTLVGAFGEVIETKSTQDLIEEEKLAKPIIQMLDYEHNVTDKDMDLPYQEIYEKFIVNSEKRNNLIKTITDSISANPKARTCILVKNLDHLQKLKDLIPNSFTIEGVNSLEDRKEAIKKFLSCKSASFLIGTKVLQTGINIEEITHLINARGLKDKIPTLQGLGRGMRKTKGKDVVYVYDFYDDIPYLRKHSKDRIRHYKKEGHEITRVKL